MDQNYETFRERLEESQTWPSMYTFKFVVPSTKKGSLLALVPTGQVSERASATGKYVSVTIKSNMKDPDQVIAAYKRVSALEGVITL